MDFTHPAKDLMVDCDDLLIFYDYMLLVMEQFNFIVIHPSNLRFYRRYPLEILLMRGPNRGKLQLLGWSNHEAAFMRTDQCVKLLDSESYK